MKTATLIFLLLVASAMTAAASTPLLSDAAPPGSTPAAVFVMVLYCIVMLVLIGIGIVLGLAFLICAAVFAALGIISSSALIALYRRRFSAGLRALHYQLSALVGLPCGIGALWLDCLLFDVHLRHRYILAAGSVIGILAGIAIAFILDRFFRFIYRRLMKPFGLRASELSQD